MTEPLPAIVSLRLPPHDAAPGQRRRRTAGADLSRLGRLAASLVALALPALGIATADTVHRAATPWATQAAAPGSPSRDAAATEGASRAGSPVREALLLTPDRTASR